MSIFLTKIHITKIFHLENIDIEIDSQEKKHLIITGANGSGKTSLLKSMLEFLERIHHDTNLTFLTYESDLIKRRNELIKLQQISTNDYKTSNVSNTIKHLELAIKEMFGKLRIEFSDIYKLPEQIRNHQFLIAFYEANRKTSIKGLTNPEKPNLTPVSKIKDGKQSEFLKFLVDLKIQEALARNENDLEGANKIKDWFEGFTTLLNDIFDGGPLTLDFNYKDYSFKIKQGHKSFGFNELSDGYSAILDIVVDLILKMQRNGSLTRVYEMEGIVLIDEIETHLHLKLQKLILPMLTRIFPKVQFIVTTHSPFVLSSLKDAVAYDLEKRKRLEDLTEYSYEALAEGYFDVNPESSFLQTKLNRYKELVLNTERDTAENAELNSLEHEFESLNEAIAPTNAIGEYLQLKLNKK